MAHMMVERKAVQRVAWKASQRVDEKADVTVERTAAEKETPTVDVLVAQMVDLTDEKKVDRMEQR